MAPVRLMTKLLVCLFPFTNGASAAIGDGGTRKNGDTCENDAPEQASMLSPLYDISALFQRKVAEVMTRLDPKSTATDYPNKDNPNKDSEDTALKDSGQDVKKKVFARPATQKLVDMNSTIDTLRALSEVTPEVISVVSGMIKTIADEIEPPIKADRKDTQDLVDTTISTLSTRTSDAVDKKKAAVAADNALNSCYAEQRRLLVLHETCRSEEETLMAEKDNTTNCNSVFLLPPEKGGFHPRSYIVRSDLQEDLVCDFSVGTCADVVGNRRANYDAWLRGLPIGPDGADKVSYDTAHAACEAAKGRLADKTASCNTMESNFENKHAHCLYALKEQQLAICMFGDSLHYKCETKQNYDTLILEIEGADNIHSESDRQSEWRGVSKLKCMLGEFVKGATFDNAMIATCTKLDDDAEKDFEAEVGLIEKKEATYTWLISEENFSCSESAITFSGVIWAVPSGVVSTHVSSDYTKQTGHEYAFDSDFNSAPFTFCAPRSAHTTCGTDFVCAAGSQKPASTTCYVEGGCTAAACCVKAPVCGDHVVDDPDEDCDDGNFVPEDGCSNECKIEASCPPPLIDKGVKSWSSTECAGASLVYEGTDCQINAAPGYDCTSPGLCTASGNFEHVGACQAISCGTDEKVVNHGCVVCPAGTRSSGGHDASGSNTMCDVIRCVVGERVENHECVSCPTGTTSTGNHDSSGENTVCDPASSTWNTVALLTTCGATGQQGPTQSACDSAYGDSSGVQVTNGYQVFTVLEAGSYKFTVKGARGGNHGQGFGGYGASLNRTRDLVVGDLLVVVVGQHGRDNPENQDWGGGGGGGSYVARVVVSGGKHIATLGLDVELLVAAGGGAGLNDRYNAGQAEGGRSGEGDPNTAAVGGKSGGGGGYILDGLGGAGPVRAKSFLNGAFGGIDREIYFGGFGGGGQPFNGGGGGGGYDGGDCNIGGTDHDCHGGSSFGGEATPNENNGDGSVSLMRS